MISGWRANAAAATSPWRWGQVGQRRRGPVVVVPRAAFGWAGDGPAVEGIVVGLERGVALTRRHDDVVEGDAWALDGVVAGVRERDLDGACRGVPAEVDRPLGPHRVETCDGVPLAGLPGRQARVGAVGSLVVGEERVEGVPQRTRVPRAGRRNARRLRQRRPVRPTRRTCLHEEVVPVQLRRPGDPERQRGPTGRHVDGTREALVRRAGRVRDSTCSPVCTVSGGSKRSGSSASQ